MRKMKYLLLCGLIITVCSVVVIIGIVLICEPTNELFGPEGGVWHCEELGVQISFDKNYPSIVLIDGKPIICGTLRHRGSKDVRVGCQVNLDQYKLGEILFRGRFIDFYNNQYVLRDMKTRKLCVFVPGELAVESIKIVDGSWNENK